MLVSREKCFMIPEATFLPAKHAASIENISIVSWTYAVAIQTLLSRVR